MRTVLKSKIHRATITSCDVDYEGSIHIPEDLMEAADILEYEQVHIWNINAPGSRFTTYAIKGEKGSGKIQVNGGAAHLVKPGDLIVIATFEELEYGEVARPIVVFPTSENKVLEVRGGRSHNSLSKDYKCQDI